VCAKEKMIRVYTAAVVAFVEHKKIADLSVVQEPRNTMDVEHSTQAPILADYCVSIGDKTTCPLPTFSKFGSVGLNRSILIRLTPKAVEKRFGKSLSLQELLRNFISHSISLVDCLSRLRLFVQREGTFIMAQTEAFSQA